MDVLVVGGSGFIGTNLASELRGRGHEVAVLSRTPDDAALPAGADAVSGDVTDYATIEAAFEGRDAVVNLVALSPLFKPSGGEEMHDRVHRQGTENVVRAAEAHDVPRLVQMSALGADPDGTTHYLRAKGRAEAIVRDSAIDWTIVRPSVVFGEGSEFVRFTRLLTTPYVTALPGGGRTRFQPIWVGDLAPMLAEVVEDEARAGETYEIGGPEVLTLADVARLAYRAEGKPLTVLPVPMALAGIGLRIGGAIPGFPMGADQYRSLQLDNTVAENDAAAFDRDPSDLRTLADYLGIPQESRTPDARTAPSSS